MTRWAGIDCGTNSIRLLVAEPSPSGGLIDVHREMRVVRLGEGVDQTGRLSEAAIERTRLALVDYAAIISDTGASHVRMVATSATRDASNEADFQLMVQGVLGADPEVISGADEAALSFAGAVAGLPGVADPLLVVDIGGGSTELVLGSAAHDIVFASHSMDVGCVRLTERHLHDDPPTAAQIADTVADLRVALDAAGSDVEVSAARTCVGVAGTVTTITAMALGLKAYDPEAIHGSTLTYPQVQEVTARLLSMSRAERAAIPVMHPGRVDVIGAGALVLQAVMKFAGVDELIASEHDILDGIVLSQLPPRP